MHSSVDPFHQSASFSATSNVEDENASRTIEKEDFSSNEETRPVIILVYLLQIRNVRNAP